MKQVVNNISIKDKKIKIYKDKDGLFYYLKNNNNDTLVTNVSDIDTAFEYCQKKNKGKL